MLNKPLTFVFGSASKCAERNVCTLFLMRFVWLFVRFHFVKAMLLNHEYLCGVGKICRESPQVKQLQLHRCDASNLHEVYRKMGRKSQPRPHTMV